MKTIITISIVGLLLAMIIAYIIVIQANNIDLNTINLSVTR